MSCDPHRSSEIERIRRVYAARELNIPSDRYSPFDDAALFLMHSRERVLLRMLRSESIRTLGGRRILDAGCGDGALLREFVTYGAKPSDLFGVDLIQERVDRARVLSPEMHILCDDVQSLPYPDASFDVVTQFTMFTSILDAEVKVNAAREIARVLKPSGLIIWFDFLVDNPANPDVKGMRRVDIETLFPGWRIDLKRTTLAPPIARVLASRSLLACQLLEKVPWLCTHYLGLIRRARSLGDNSARKEKGT